MKKSIVITLFILVCVGCDKNFLDKKPVGTASLESLFEDADGLRLAVNGIYDIFQGSIWGGAWYYMQPHFDAVTEDAKIEFPWEGGYFDLATGTIAPNSDGIVSSKWNYGYKGIARANAVLANVDNPGINIDEMVRLKYKAEARFLRGYIYSQLLTYYGGVPLILEPVDIIHSKVPRNTREEVLNSILGDLDFAAQHLGITPLNNEHGRATKQAAMGMKARVLLYEKNWTGAAQVAKEVMDLEGSGAVSLSSNYEGLFNGSNKKDKEILFDIQHVGQTTSTPNVGEGNFLTTCYGPKGFPTGTGWGSISYLEPMFDAFYMKDGLPKNLSPLYDPNDPYANRDPRFYWSFLVPGISTWAGQPYTAANYSGHVPSLPINTKKWVSEKDVNSQAGNANYILLRYADVILMYAEAQNEAAGPDNTVYAAINKVRARAQMPDVTPGLTQSQMREEIRHERKVELSQEGLRYFDIVRWGIAKQLINSNTSEVRNWKEYNALLPIPQSEMDINPQLVQNPGYPR